MSNDPNNNQVYGSSDGGLAGTLAAAADFSLLVGPSTADEYNTARLRLIPIACWRVDDVRFAFDSSFVTPDITGELQLLARLREQNKNAAGLYPPLSVFGHADPVGTDDYNKALSGRRANAVYAILISNSDASAAAGIWQTISATENWGDSQNNIMLTITGLPAGTSGTQLFQAYMQKLYPAELKLTRQDFLAQGADTGGKGDVQGCSEFNPVLIFSQSDAARYDQAAQDNNQDMLAERNAANASNRRVVVLLFRPGSQVIPTKWPCPRTGEGVAGCHLRFWSNGEERRSKQLPEARRYEKTKDTFACRFYDRIGSQSPCDQHITMEDYPFSL
jgi:hypothetical protein